MSESSPVTSPLDQHCATARYVAYGLVVFLILFRLVRLEADFPFAVTWDGDAFTDEGLYACDAITWHLEGWWYNRMDFNQAINVPVLQFIQAMAFKFIGFGLWTARFVNLVFSVLLIAATAMLVKRYAGNTAALITAVLFSANHIFFALSRFALAEVPVAFFIMLTVLCASHVRGRWWPVFAVITSVSYAIAMLTKTNAVFAAPIVAVVVIMQDVDWAAITSQWQGGSMWRSPVNAVKAIAGGMNWMNVLAKFVLCSAVFFACIGTYWFTMVAKYTDEFFYFYSLNLGMTSSLDPGLLYEKFMVFVIYVSVLDPPLWLFAIPMTIFLACQSKAYRTNPLLWISIAWFVLYMFLYAYYGRFWPRFFGPLVPAVMAWAGLTLYEYFRLPRHLLPIAWFVAGIFLASGAYNLFKIGVYTVDTQDTYGDMARDIRRIMDADPESNNVLIGHIASSVALRNGAFPRNDRYGVERTDARLLSSKPTYWIMEGVERGYPLEPYYQHREVFHRLYHIETVARYNPLWGYRGYPVTLYKLRPRATPAEEYDPEAMVEEMLAFEQRRIEAGEKLSK